MKSLFTSFVFLIVVGLHGQEFNLVPANPTTKAVVKPEQLTGNWHVDRAETSSKAGSMAFRGSTYQEWWRIEIANGTFAVSQIEYSGFTPVGLRPMTIANLSFKGNRLSFTATDKGQTVGNVRMDRVLQVQLQIEDADTIKGSFHQDSTMMGGGYNGAGLTSDGTLSLVRIADSGTAPAQGKPRAESSGSAAQAGRGGPGNASMKAQDCPQCHLRGERACYACRGSGIFNGGPCGGCNGKGLVKCTALTCPLKTKLSH